jgi:hypothetical protein
VIRDQSEVEEEDAIVQKEFVKCQEAMTNLARRGYQLTPFIDGAWRREPITEWRIVPTEELRGRLASVEEDDEDYPMTSVESVDTNGNVILPPVLPRGSSFPDSLFKLLTVAKNEMHQ